MPQCPECLWWSWGSLLCTVSAGNINYMKTLLDFDIQLSFQRHSTIIVWKEVYAKTVHRRTVGSNLHSVTFYFETKQIAWLLARAGVKVFACSYSVNLWFVYECEKMVSSTGPSWSPTGLSWSFGCWAAEASGKRDDVDFYWSIYNM